MLILIAWVIAAYIGTYKLFDQYTGHGALCLIGWMILMGEFKYEGQKYSLLPECKLKRIAIGLVSFTGIAYLVYTLFI